MRNTRNDQRGFTLMEMLIVVAIIAILIAVAIPTFSSQLEKARAATDQANVRSAYAVAQTCLLLNQLPDGSDTGSLSTNYANYYMKKDGTFVRGDGSCEAKDLYKIQSRSAVIETVSSFDTSGEWAEARQGSYILILVAVTDKTVDDCTVYPATFISP